MSSRRRYRSLIRQTLHYLSRPHESIARAPIASAAAWRANELEPSQWRETLDEDAIAELERGLEVARGTGQPVAALRRSDFPLPTLTSRIDRWRRELTHGRGFVVIRGIPVDRWSRADTEAFFWCLGLHLGIPGAQNPRGDLLGHVTDEGATVGQVRQYRTNEAIGFHCDTADVVGLLCLRAARRGGNSRIASSVAVYNALVERHLELVDVLYEPFELDTRGDGGLTRLPVVPCRHAAGRLRTFFHGPYYRSAPEQPGATPLSDRQRAVLDAYEAILDEPGVALSMDLRPGDIQLVNNHYLVHSREGYEDHEEPERRRHLLRLWLSLDEPQPLPARISALAAGARVLRGASKQWLGRLRS